MKFSVNVLRSDVWDLGSFPVSVVIMGDLVFYFWTLNMEIVISKYVSMEREHEIQAIPMLVQLHILLEGLCIYFFEDRISSIH